MEGYTVRAVEGDGNKTLAQQDHELNIKAGLIKEPEVHKVDLSDTPERRAQKEAEELKAKQEAEAKAAKDAEEANAKKEAEEWNAKWKAKNDKGRALHEAKIIDDVKAKFTDAYNLSDDNIVMTFLMNQHGYTKAQAHGTARNMDREGADKLAFQQMKDFYFDNLDAMYDDAIAKAKRDNPYKEVSATSQLKDLYGNVKSTKWEAVQKAEKEKAEKEAAEAQNEMMVEKIKEDAQNLQKPASNGSHSAEIEALRAELKSLRQELNPTYEYKGMDDVETVEYRSELQKQLDSQREAYKNRSVLNKYNQGQKEERKAKAQNAEQPKALTAEDLASGALTFKKA